SAQPEDRELRGRDGPGRAAVERDVQPGDTPGVEHDRIERDRVEQDRIERDRLVDDYLWHEVFDSESREVVDVLLDIPVVERVNPSLAESLTGRTDADRLLVAAERRGLFVTKLDTASWFEVHALVRELLVNELATRSPERLRRQHERAARWFEEAGELTSALD